MKKNNFSFKDQLEQINKLGSNLEEKARTVVVEILESSSCEAAKKLENLRILKEEVDKISKRDEKNEPMSPYEKETFLELLQIFEEVEKVAKGFSAPSYCLGFYRYYLLSEILKICENEPQDDLWCFMKFLLSVSFPETFSLEERLLLIKDVDESIEISRRYKDFK